jgi:anthranilate phosphoribosyltransferase
MKEFIKKITEGNSLSYEEAKIVMNTIMNGEATDSQIAALCVAEKMKNETKNRLFSFMAYLKFLNFTD